MRDIFVEDFESELFTTAFKKYFGEISTSTRNWEMLFQQMNAEKDTTKAIMRLDGNTVVGFIMFCEIELQCIFFSEKFGYIRELWVDTPHRHAGHGSHLMHLAEQYFVSRKMPQMALKATSNSEEFYRNQGYSSSEVIVSEGEKIFTKKI
ncbi:MAG: GNAT family N-acetyltransferase [Clostridia bacterium]|nr:GNAT family N-acetyltransferase [Clostridia bacterium]